MTSRPICCFSAWVRRTSSSSCFFFLRKSKIWSMISSSFFALSKPPCPSCGPPPGMSPLCESGKSGGKSSSSSSRSSSSRSSSCMRDWNSKEARSCFRRCFSCTKRPLISSNFRCDSLLLPVVSRVHSLKSFSSWIRSARCSSVIFFFAFLSAPPTPAPMNAALWPFGKNPAPPPPLCPRRCCSSHSLLLTSTYSLSVLEVEGLDGPETALPADSALLTRHCSG
mmetsp:Transcript_30601/g.47948  ORF Transcript_30601/g.47948 Transcript_30601/m.47948 type:complete len:224 (-) Transcript_30601:1538-2209(-)